MKSYGKMLRTLRKRAGYGLVQVAKKLQDRGFDVTNTNVSRWENGYNNPSLEQFVTLCALYGVRDLHATFGEENLDALGPGLNREGGEQLEAYRDLLVQSGWFSKDAAEPGQDSRPPFRLEFPEEMRQQMEERGSTPPPRSQKRSDAAEMPMVDPTVRQIPLYTVGPSAGTGNPIDDADYEMMPVPASAPQGADFAVYVDGNSMEPVLSNGELLYVHAQPTLEDGEIGVVTLNGATYVKQLRDLPAGVWLVSANPGYQPMHIDEYDSLVVHGKVIEPHIPKDHIIFQPAQSDDEDWDPFADDPEA